MSSTYPLRGVTHSYDFKDFSETEIGKEARMLNLWRMTEGRAMVSDRLFPDFDINFRMSVDEIVSRIASEEIIKERERNKK